jgi:hypothetical protein
MEENEVQGDFIFYLLEMEFEPRQSKAMLYPLVSSRGCLVHL